MSPRYLILVLAIFVLGQPAALCADYPEKPIKIVVYTAPGGLIDVTARKIAGVMQSKYTNVPVVVENKKGAGGLIALQHVSRQPADGYTVFGLTSSVVTYTVSTKKESMLDSLEYLLRVVDDYESIIVKEGTMLADAKSIVEQAKSSGGSQIWVGPAAGGTDHLFAKKFWSASGIAAKWIPYRSGGEAIAALLGGHGSVYVGNPADVIGRQGLRIAAVAAPERLEEFPEVPTFKELGYDSLTGESLWRGFAVRKGVPAEKLDVLKELFQSVLKDEEWLKYLKMNAVRPFQDDPLQFAAAVEKQIASDKEHLSS